MTKFFAGLVLVTLALILVGACVDVCMRGSLLLPTLRMSLAAAVIWCAAFWLMKRFAWSLIDEVVDDGDALVLRRGDVEQRVALSDIWESIHRPFGRSPRMARGVCDAGAGARVRHARGLRALDGRDGSEVARSLRQRIDAAKAG